MIQEKKIHKYPVTQTVLGKSIFAIKYLESYLICIYLCKMMSNWAPLPVPEHIIL